MHIRIEHCTVCWGYRNRALILADQLEQRFGAKVDAVEGTLGQFDVHLDGILIWSRGKNLLARMAPPRLPDVSEVIAAIERERVPPEDRTSVHGSATDEFSPADAKHFYDRFGAWQDTQFYENNPITHLLPHSDFEHASTILELGCGTGRLAESLFNHHLPGDATYVGIDISTTMLKIARRRLVDWSGRATVLEADGTAELPFRDRVFDRYIAAYVLDLLPECGINHVLSEARRVLHTNGKLCVLSLTEGITPVSRIVSAAWKRLYRIDPRLVGGCRPLHVLATLNSAAWKIEHSQTVCSWGICSEITIACAA